MYKVLTCVNDEIKFKAFSRFYSIKEISKLICYLYTKLFIKQIKRTTQNKNKYLTGTPRIIG